MKTIKGIEHKVKLLLQRYKVEIMFYEQFLEKLKQESEIIKSGDIESTMALIQDKAQIMRNINGVEKEISEYKEDYFKSKASGLYTSKDLDRLLLKLSFLIEELIRLQKRNEELLNEKMASTRMEIADLRRRNMITDAYKHETSAGHVR